MSTLLLLLIIAVAAAPFDAREPAVVPGEAPTLAALPLPELEPGLEPATVATPLLCHRARRPALWHCYCWNRS